MVVVSIGVDHKNASIEEREALAFDPEQARRFLEEPSAELPERLLISTCNRTELFAVSSSDDGSPEKHLAELLLRARGVAVDGRKVHRQEDSIRHLFRVASGVESMVLGEAQILGQVKEAGELAVSCGAAGPVLKHLLEAAVRVAKKARTETSIGEGAVSIASAAVDLAKKVFGDLSDRVALVVGAGETGRLVARHLHASGIGKMLVANRTLDRAIEVAEEVQAEAWGLCGIPPGLRDADIVVAATAAEQPVLTHSEIKGAMRRRKGRMLLILDIAIPRDVEKSAGRIESVFLHDIDALESIVDNNLEIRRKAVPKVEEMIEEAVRGFMAWHRGLAAIPTIKALRTELEKIRQTELAANLKRVPPEARDEAERLTESLLNRILHHPTIRLRKAAKEPGGGADLASATRELFGIEEDEDA